VIEINKNTCCCAEQIEQRKQYHEKHDQNHGLMVRVGAGVKLEIVHTSTSAIADSLDEFAQLKRGERGREEGGKRETNSKLNVGMRVLVEEMVRANLLPKK
jgi:pyruvate/2-oxoglutarate dehydrogenase complex dihydrolipoamide acyltransferase (E2) component